MRRLLLMAVLVAGCGGASATAGASPTSIPTLGIEPVVKAHGVGTIDSQPFALDGGQYRADWTADTHAHGCVHLLILHSQGSTPQYSGTIASATLAQGDPGTGTSYLQDVPAGTFFVAPKTICDWSVALRRTGP
jgi:hypothetical protein